MRLCFTMCLLSSLLFHFVYAFFIGLLNTPQNVFFSVKSATPKVSCWAQPRCWMQLRHDFSNEYNKLCHTGSPFYCYYYDYCLQNDAFRTWWSIRSVRHRFFLNAVHSFERNKTMRCIARAFVHSCINAFAQCTCGQCLYALFITHCGRVPVFIRAPPKQ